MNDYILVFVYRIVFAMFDIAVLGYSQIHNNNGGKILYYECETKESPSYIYF